jgi:hypothetical protein
VNLGIDVFRGADHAAGSREPITEISCLVLLRVDNVIALPDRGLRIGMCASARVELFALGRDWYLGRRRSLSHRNRRQQKYRNRQFENSDCAHHRTIPFGHVYLQNITA